MSPEPKCTPRDQNPHVWDAVHATHGLTGAWYLERCRLCGMLKETTLRYMPWARTIVGFYPLAVEDDVPVEAGS